VTAKKHLTVQLVAFPELCYLQRTILTETTVPFHWKFHRHQVLSRSLPVTACMLFLINYIVTTLDHSCYQRLLYTKGKGKVLPYSSTSAGSRPNPGVQAVGLQVNFRQACGHLPSRRTSPSIDQYQVIMLSDRGT